MKIMSLPLRKLDKEGFREICQRNPELHFELTKDGVLIVMPPKGGSDGNRSFTLIGLFGKWAETNGTGQGFSSTTGFDLPNEAIRSPDLSWVKNERWNSLTEEEQEDFPPICPDFVVELRSDTDSLKTLQDKMEEYIENGAQLGWLIDPIKKKVYVYRPNEKTEELENPQTVSGFPFVERIYVECAEDLGIELVDEFAKRKRCSENKPNSVSYFQSNKKN